MVATSLAEFSDSDMRLLAQTADPRLLDRLDVLKGDPSIIEGILDQEAGRLFQRIMSTTDDTVMATISPRLLFEVLLRQALTELHNQRYTFERRASQTLPVFDAGQVVQFLDNRAVLRYLGQMLCSFTRTNAYTLPVRVRKGIWWKVRFSDIDVDSLRKACDAAPEDLRFGYYKRIADVCLFVLGMFPEYAGASPGYGTTNEATTHLQWRHRRSPEEYEEEGKRFYGLAAQHQQASLMGLEDVLLQLHQSFNLAMKPLGHLSTHFLQFRREQLFPSAGTPHNATG